MRRRDLLLSIGGSAFLCPHGMVGAQSRKPVIGVLVIGSPGGWMYGPFIEGLRKLGYEDGQSAVIEIRYAHGDITRYPKLAQELLDRSPGVIVATVRPQPSRNS